MIIKSNTRTAVIARALGEGILTATPAVTIMELLPKTNLSIRDTAAIAGSSALPGILHGLNNGLKNLGRRAERTERGAHVARSGRLAEAAQQKLAYRSY